jgi:hypothetical protein
MTIAGRRARPLLAIVALLASGAAALSQLDPSFMPKGGKALLLELFGASDQSAELRNVLTSRRSEDEWGTALGERAKKLSERERRTLTAYLAVNMPLQQEALGQVKQPGGLEQILPRDGRELAWYECQSCHSLFASHLTQDRSVQAWLNMFQSPFHRGLKMSAQEREEFARYSAINMPMKTEDVPRDLRF